jgi:hypothetical protein
MHCRRPAAWLTSNRLVDCWCTSHLTLAGVSQQPRVHVQVHERLSLALLQSSPPPQKNLTHTPCSRRLASQSGPVFSCLSSLSHLQVCLSNPDSKGKYINVILALLQSPPPPPHTHTPCSRHLASQSGSVPLCLCSLPQSQVCLSNPESKGKYIKIILALLQSPSSAVVYECAVTLTKLSQAPTAIRAAANCYCQVCGICPHACQQGVALGFSRCMRVVSHCQGAHSM